MKTEIAWNNASNASSLLAAEKDLREDGSDIGWDKTFNLMPKDDNHHHWMSYASYLTGVYNRDNTPKRYSIFRMVTNLQKESNKFYFKFFRFWRRRSELCSCFKASCFVCFNFWKFFSFFTIWVADICCRDWTEICI